MSKSDFYGWVWFFGLPLGLVVFAVIVFW